MKNISAKKGIIVITILFVNVVTCFSHYVDTLDDMDTDILNSDTEEPGSDMDVDGIPRHKRAPQFSLDGDLRSLVQMLYSKQNDRRRTERSGLRSALLKIGRRSWRTPNMNSYNRKLETDSYIDTYPRVSRRRSQQLSVSGPLSALANMLAAEGRRRKHTALLSNRMKLLELGKRSSKDDSFVDKSNDDIRDSLEREY